MSNVKYILQEDGAFMIEDYNHAKPFANFFPGVAGIWGVPLWAFYVNRGQCIASFGFESKDNSILEFQPANKAYRMTPRDGFRTFLKIKSNGSTTFYEPFQNNPTTVDDIEQRMIMNSHDLTLVDTNKTLGIETIVNFFTMPEESYPALVRKVEVKNIGQADVEVECVDGMPGIIAYGANDWLNKHLSRTIEAWIKVRNVEASAPFYQLNVEVNDTSEVTYIKEGNFYFGFDLDNTSKLLPVIVQAEAVFGQATDFSAPEAFINADTFVVPKVQQTSNRTASAMTYQSFKLKVGASKKSAAIVGHTHSIDELNKIIDAAKADGFLGNKAGRNAEITDQIKNKSLINSGSKAFNFYAQQNFLDNVLRGGMPVTIQTGEGPAVFNVFSRKHGDLERDYNFFFLAATFYTQGNGNFRDVNQNRRNDIWLNTDLQDTSVINFFNLSQADGYNPLVVKGMRFSVVDEKGAAKIVSQFVAAANADQVNKFLAKSFMPGDLFQFISKNNVELKGDAREFLTQILGVCQKREVADHGEGFWSDHWHYNLDLVESYLALYPERLQELLIDKKEFSFFHNDAYVVPREERYVLTDKGVRQYNSVKEAEEEIQAHKTGHILRTHHGKGHPYKTNLVAKMVCVLANKVASLDPSGIGVEMESDKPNWYDALNGLPALTGSSISETFEVRRFAQFVLASLQKLNIADDDSISLFGELSEFVHQLTEILKSKQDALQYWHKSNDIKERYRTNIRHGIQGDEFDVTIADIKEFMQLIINRTNKGIESAKDKEGLFATYFSHEVTEYVELDEERNGRKCVAPKIFKRHDLPYFLEGFVHALRAETDQNKAQELYDKVKKTDLYDKKLGMYRVNTNLAAESEEIGRTRVFPRGWLENESIWLHMEYKYLLETLRRGLNSDFYKDLLTSCVPFQDPNVYGRNILENSSFIASSSHEDKNLHGQGFVARLSGSTAEFFHILMFMAVGQHPFNLDDQGNLSLTFQPTLTADMFTDKESSIGYFGKSEAAQEVALPANTFSFNFMAHTLLVYHNPKRKATFDKGCVAIQKYDLTYVDGSTKSVDGVSLPSDIANDVRNNSVSRIDAYLA